MSCNFTPACIDDDNDYKKKMNISFITLSMLVIAESVLIMFIIWRSPKLHTNTNMFIVSVRVADIFYATSFGTSATINMFYRNIVADAILLDILMLGVSYSTLTLSMAQMGVIAVDRYINIVHPFFYIKQVTRRRVLAIVLCYWILAFVYGATPLLVYRNTQCYEFCIISKPPGEYSLVMSIAYIVNFFLILILYTRIAVLAYRRNKSAQDRQLSNPDPVNNYRNYRTPAWKSVKFCAIMCGIYVLCTGPSGIVAVVNLKYAVPIYVYGPLLHLYLVHSLLNFFVYINMNTNFEEAVRKIFVDMKRR